MRPGYFCEIARVTGIGSSGVLGCFIQRINAMATRLETCLVCADSMTGRLQHGVPAISSGVLRLNIGSRKRKQVLWVELRGTKINLG